MKRHKEIRIYLNLKSDRDLIEYFTGFGSEDMKSFLREALGNVTPQQAKLDVLLQEVRNISRKVDSMSIVSVPAVQPSQEEYEDPELSATIDSLRLSW